MKKKFELKLEVREGALADHQPLAPFGIEVTPAINDEYWLLRVKVSETQSIVGFPKFSLLGVGFAVEGADWNVNSPSGMDADHIYSRIKVNKGDDSIPKARCVKAIKLIQQAWEAVK